jgi:hypothetical protein
MHELSDWMMYKINKQEYYICRFNMGILRTEEKHYFSAP